jgi:hypothetical protein
VVKTELDGVFFQAGRTWDGDKFAIGEFSQKR